VILFLISRFFCKVLRAPLVRSLSKKSYILFLFIFSIPEMKTSFVLLRFSLIGVACGR
jgi:hypothetical protein